LKAEAALSLELEQSLGKLLRYGTFAASAVIALGMAIFPVAGAAGTRAATAGIVLFILLPVLRIGAMLVFFLRTRDYRFGAIAALVMLIIFTSFLVGAAES
jgi:uncharacterized membrane protein